MKTITKVIAITTLGTCLAACAVASPLGDFFVKGGTMKGKNSTLQLKLTEARGERMGYQVICPITTTKPLDTITYQPQIGAVHIISTTINKAPAERIGTGVLLPGANTLSFHFRFTRKNLPSMSKVITLTNNSDDTITVGNCTLLP